MSYVPEFLASSAERFLFYKKLGEEAFGQLSEEQLFWRPNGSSNSIATIVKHLSGNMLSRWTDFLTTDGEKTWRNRESEFFNDLRGLAEVKEKWEAGWGCLQKNLAQVNDSNFDTVIYIRSQPHSIIMALDRQVTHIAYHVGQIVFLAKMILDGNWRFLSIAPGQSPDFNAEMQQKFVKP